MKTLGLVLLSLIGLNAFGQKPERVYSIVKERRSLEWYQEQEKIWKEETIKNKNNAFAYSNYYEAVRAQFNLLPWGSDERIPFQARMDSIANEGYANNPDSFDGNFLMYRNFRQLGSPQEDEYFKYLEKAYEIDPLDSRTYVDFMVHYEVKRDLEKRNEFCEKFFVANELSGGHYNWAYNLFTELDENAILITTGDNDTFPFWVLQGVKNLRNDVTVINTSLLNLDFYRKAIFEQVGLSTIDKNLNDCKTNDEYQELLDSIMSAIFDNDMDVPVYIASTAVSRFEEKYGDNLYLVGLSYLYCTNEVDNISLIKRNYENRYLLDYLLMSFAFNISDNLSVHVNYTYLAPFLKLYSHYKLSEDKEQIEELEIYIEAISKANGNYDEVQQILKDC